jgi:uncharacterized linocin/CFP29 family protein
VASITIDDADAVTEIETDGLITTGGRKYEELPTVFEDFTLLAKDLESAGKTGFPLDFSKAMKAAEACALKEDTLIFFGNKKLGYDGLLTAPNTGKIKKNDWSVGENAFSDVAAGMSHLAKNGFYGPFALAVSPDLYMQMQRLQPGTGMLEIDRVAKLVGGHIYPARVLGQGKAVLVASDEANMDLAIGQDMATAYLEQKDLNHVFRILETVLPRLKRQQAIVVFE